MGFQNRPIIQNISTQKNSLIIINSTFVETNIFWSEAEEEDKWCNIIQQSKRTKGKSAVPAYLKKPTIQTLNQPGGVISMAFDSATNRVIDSGKDNDLGRWLWIPLRGKNNICTTIISGYRLQKYR